MQESILSVVMPCLNGMPHLPAAIESARSILPADNLEIVVADGGSTDGSLDFLRGAGVRLIDSPDRSLYEGLNNAVAEARGEYIAWLNSDDVILPDFAALWLKARQENADMATGEAEIARNGKIVWKSDHNARLMDIASILFAVPTVNSRVINARLFRKSGAFRSDIGLGADREMLLRLLHVSQKRIKLDSTVYRYNAHIGSKTIAATWKSYQDVHKANTQLAVALKDQLPRGIEPQLLAAFASVSALGRARAEFFGRRPFAALSTVLRAVGDNLSLKNWNRGLSEHRLYRGHGSGW